jgi:heme/copper-type cytochrome/quinol oxidase subunit 3
MKVARLLLQLLAAAFVILVAGGIMVALAAHLVAAADIKNIAQLIGATAFLGVIILALKPWRQ